MGKKREKEKKERLLENGLNFTSIQYKTPYLVYYINQSFANWRIWTKRKYPINQSFENWRIWTKRKYPSTLVYIKIEFILYIYIK